MNYGYVFVCMHVRLLFCVVSRSFFRCLLFLTSSSIHIVEGGNGVEAAESSSSKVSLALDFGSVTLCKSKV